MVVIGAAGGMGSRPFPHSSTSSSPGRGGSVSLLGAVLLAELLVSLLLSSAHAATAAAEKSKPGDYAAAANYSTLGCEAFDPTYPQIDSDLEIHRQLGTHLNSTKYIAGYLGSVQMRGLTVGCVEKGRAGEEGRGQGACVHACNYGGARSGKL